MRLAVSAIFGTCWALLSNASPSTPLWCSYSATSNASSCLSSSVSSNTCYRHANLSYGGVMGTHHLILDHDHPAMGAFAEFAWDKIEKETAEVLGASSHAVPVARRTCNMTLLELRTSFDGAEPFEQRFRNRQGEVEQFPVFAGVTAFALLKTVWARPSAVNTAQIIVLDHKVTVTYDVTRSMTLTEHTWEPAAVGAVELPAAGTEAIGDEIEDTAEVIPAWIRRSIGDDWLPSTCSGRRERPRRGTGRPSATADGLGPADRGIDWFTGTCGEMNPEELTKYSLRTELCEPVEDGVHAGADLAAGNQSAPQPSPRCTSLLSFGRQDFSHWRCSRHRKPSEVGGAAADTVEVRPDASFEAVAAARLVDELPAPPPGASEGYPVPRLRGLPQAAAKAVLRNFRAVCYNAWNSNPPSWLVPNPQARFQRYRDRLDLLAEQVGPLQPDVVLLQEVRLDSTLGGPNEHGQMAHIAARFPGYQYVSQPAMLHHGFGREGPSAGGFGGGLHHRDEEGVAVLSRHPIVLSEYALLSRDADDRHDGHQRVVLHALVELSTSPGLEPLLVDVYTVHMPLGVRARRRLAREMHAFVRASRRGHAVVVAGDMNAEPDEPCIQFWQGLGPPPQVPSLTEQDEMMEAGEEDQKDQKDLEDDEGGGSQGEENRRVDAEDVDTCDWGQLLGHDDASSRSGFFDAWMVPASDAGESALPVAVGRDGTELPSLWGPLLAGAGDGAGAGTGSGQGQAERLLPREVALGWPQERVLREAMTFPSDNPAKRIDFVFVAHPDAAGAWVSAGSSCKAAAWARAGRVLAGQLEGYWPANDTGCFERPALAMTQVTAAWLVGQDPKPGVGNLTAKGLGMVSPDSPLWASDHRGLVVDLRTLVGQR